MKEKNMQRTLGIYIHIPFCVRKCLYCDFLSAPADEKERERYVKALIREISRESQCYVNYTVESIFLGGGTPSLLWGESIAEILDAVYSHFAVSSGCETTIEVNPGTVTYQKMALWRRAGVNRISIGLQTTVDEELLALGRIHTAEMFFDTYEMAVQSGFDNRNVDFMFGIPGQTLKSCEDTLNKILGLTPPPTHISAYSLIVEEGTPFYRNPPELPDEDTEREMYRMTGKILGAHGYCQYEISNYAKPGFMCRHNLRYWQRGNYVGFGAGAASMVENVRFQNISYLTDYVNYYLDEGKLKKPKAERQILSVKEQMEEFMFLGLRMTKGVSVREFSTLFGVTIDQMYPGIVEEYCKKGLLERKREQETKDERIRLTPFGMDVSNVVMAEFLFP